MYSYSLPSMPLSISIHAPPRGATLSNVPATILICISIHAPPRGATECKNNHRSIAGFQFTPLREGRRRRQKSLNMRRNISIHAPPRGATSSFLSSVPHQLFQFTPLREGRHTASHSVHHSRKISIHAPPRGATRKQNALSNGGTYFNSRPSARGDRKRKSSFYCWQYFNSRPSARGDRCCSCGACGTTNISIHAPPRGATGIRGGHTIQAIYFNSRPSARGDDDAHRAGTADAISIHAPPRGATNHLSGGQQHDFTFQFTPLREGRRARA